MIPWAVNAAAAPLLAPAEEAALDAFARCAREADAVGGGLPDPGPLGTTDRVAVVIGVPCHRGSGVPALAYATRDAVRVGEVLQGAGFAVIPLLTSVDRAQIEAALSRAEAALSPGGTLVVYFSGHGILRDDLGVVRRFLVATDTDLGSLPTTGYAVRDLEQRVSAIPAGRRVIVQDTCFASRGEDGAKGLGMLEPSVPLPEGDARLFASRFFEQAVESPELRGSVYTAHLLGALSEPASADLDGDGCVGLLEAHRRATALTSAARAGFQVPQIEENQAENLVLGCTPRPPTRAVVLASSTRRVTVTDRSGAEVGPSVPPGTYRVEVATADDERLLVERRRLDAGEWLEVDDALERRAGLAVVSAELGFVATRESGRVPFGLSGWVAPRDHGAGRPVVGFAARSASGGTDPDWRWVVAEASVSGGWSWTAPAPHARAGGGPAIEVVGLMRSADARASGGGAAGPFLGVAVEPQARGWLVVSGVAATATLGVRALPLSGGEQGPVELAPTVRIGLGGASGRRSR